MGWRVGKNGGLEGRVRGWVGEVIYLLSEIMEGWSCGYLLSIGSKVYIIMRAKRVVGAHRLPSLNRVGLMPADAIARSNNDTGGAGIVPVGCCPEPPPVPAFCPEPEAGPVFCTGEMPPVERLNTSYNTTKC